MLRTAPNSSRVIRLAAACGFCTFVITAQHCTPAYAAKVPRAVLKEYFQTGDKPTQSQFQALIDSLINEIDDGITTYEAGDSSGRAARLDEGSIIGPGLLFGNVDGLSDDWIGQSGYLGLSFIQNGEQHFGYLICKTPSPAGPVPIPYPVTIDYLVYEDQPNTPIVATVPEPSGLLLAAIGGTIYGWRRIRTRRAR